MSGVTLEYSRERPLDGGDRYGEPPEVSKLVSRAVNQAADRPAPRVQHRASTETANHLSIAELEELKTILLEEGLEIDRRAAPLDHVRLVYSPAEADELEDVGILPGDRPLILDTDTGLRRWRVRDLQQGNVRQRIETCLRGADLYLWHATGGLDPKLPMYPSYRDLVHSVDDMGAGKYLARRDEEPCTPEFAVPVNTNNTFPEQREERV
jgi:hypothetical protein